MRRSLWLLLIPVLLATFAIGAHGLYADSVWADEFHSIEDSGGMPGQPMSPEQIWSNLAATNPWHVPGYFLALSGWGKLVGWEPPSLRALSLLAGMLSIALTYRLGCDTRSRTVGLFAATILASSAFYMHFLHELRMYTLVTLFAALETWLYVRIIRFPRRATRRHFVALFLGAVGLLYTHYFAATILIGIGVFHLLFVGKDRRWWQVSLTFVLAGLTFLAWVQALSAGVQLAEADTGIHEIALTPPQAIEQLARMAGNGSLPLLLLILGFALIAAYRRATMPLTILMVALAVTLAVIGVLQIMTVGRLRYLIHLWSLLSVLLALGIIELGERLPASIRARRAVPVFVLFLWAGIGLTRMADPEFLQDLDTAAVDFPIQHVAYAIRDKIQPGDLVLQYLNELPRRERPAIANTRQQIYFRDLSAPYRFYPQRNDADGKRKELADLINTLAGHDHVWLIYDPARPALDLPRLLDALTTGYVACPAPLDLPDAHVSEFAPAASACIL